jgi:hypothetical protein
MNNQTIIQIMSHTEKSFAVVTNKVLIYQDLLSKLGGIFDQNIVNKETGETFMGWIFYMDKKDEIQNWINEGCQPIIKNRSQRFEKILFPPKINTKKVSLSPINKEDRIKSIEKSIETLLSKINSLEFENSLLIRRVNSLETEVNSLKTDKVKDESTVDYEEDYEIMDIVSKEFKTNL